MPHKRMQVVLLLCSVFCCSLQLMTISGSQAGCISYAVTLYHYAVRMPVVSAPWLRIVSQYGFW